MILYEPDSLIDRTDRDKLRIAKIFLQTMLNRMYVGDLRYGPPNKKQKYMTRLIREVEAYKKNGNAEQLLNIANYCILEWITPEHPKHHFDPTVKSVTRKNAGKKDSM